MFLDGSKCTKTVSKDLVKLIPVVDDKPPFANYGCADLRPDIGMKRTHNVNVPPKWVCFVSLRGRGVRHFFSMFSLFYREFYKVQKRSFCPKINHADQKIIGTPKMHY